MVSGNWNLLWYFPKLASFVFRGFTLYQVDDSVASIYPNGKESASDLEERFSCKQMIFSM